MQKCSLLTDFMALGSHLGIQNVFKLLTNTLSFAEVRSFQEEMHLPSYAMVLLSELMGNLCPTQQIV